MSLNKQIYLYSIATDAFYDEEEQAIHKRMLKLYSIRKRLKDEKLIKKNPVDIDIPFWKTTINKLIAEEKETLTEKLNKRLRNHEPRQLNPMALRDRDIITLFDSSLTRALNIEPQTLTKDLMVLNVFFFQIFEGLVKDGFIYDGEKYVFLTASAGQIRTKRAVFIKESAYNKIQKKLMCGLSIKDINEHGGINPNKYLAYLALCNSATDVWEDFDIDKSIVVDDFETNVFTEVDYIDELDYSITRQSMDVAIPHMDGCGIMLDEGTRMVRMPWVKGLLVTFPFDKFIEEKCNGNGKIVDIYGHEYDIVADNIRYIFTKSQFKLYKYYSSWEQYKEYFKKYQCEACYCNLEDPYIPKAKINYQMLQTLSDIRDDEIEKIMKRTIEEIENVGNDFQTTMRLLGATDYNKSPNYFQQGVMIYPELFRDTYHKDILKQTKKSLVKQAKGGRLAVNGRYQFISPDLYAFCEWLFLDEQNPKGLLSDGEVYSGLNRNGAELACLRSPHLYREWAIRKNKKDTELDKWFGMTKCVYTSTHDTISKILQFDCDGDKALVVQDRTLTAIAKRNMKDIVPLYYNMRKAKGGELNNNALYDGMARAYTGGNIGPVSNNITKIWNCGKPIEEEQLNVVKWLCMENNFVIDYAKTLYQPTRPKHIDNVIKSYTKSKVPNFFVYAKDKEFMQVESANQSTMNRISAVVPNPKVRFSKSISKFDYRMLMNKDYDFTIRESPIIDEYNYWVTHRYPVDEINESVDDEDLFIYQQIRSKILAYGEINYVVNTLVNYCYTVKVNSSKKVLWSCFGDVIIKNLKKNTSGLGQICPICGKRFNPINRLQKCCSTECAQELNARGQYDRNAKN